MRAQRAQRARSRDERSQTQGESKAAARPLRPRRPPAPRIVNGTISPSSEAMAICGGGAPGRGTGSVSAYFPRPLSWRASCAGSHRILQRRLARALALRLPVLRARAWDAASAAEHSLAGALDHVCAALQACGGRTSSGSRSRVILTLPSSSSPPSLALAAAATRRCEARCGRAPSTASVGRAGAGARRAARTRDTRGTDTTRLATAAAMTLIGGKDVC